MSFLSESQMRDLTNQVSIPSRFDTYDELDATEKIVYVPPCIPSHLWKDIDVRRKVCARSENSRALSYQYFYQYSAPANEDAAGDGGVNGGDGERMVDGKRAAAVACVRGKLLSTTTGTKAAATSLVVAPSLTTDGKPLDSSSKPKPTGLAPALVAAVTPLDGGNKGFRMLQMMGWNAGTGLGKRRTGRIEPVCLDLTLGNTAVQESFKKEKREAVRGDGKKKKRKERQTTKYAGVDEYCRRKEESLTLLGDVVGLREEAWQRTVWEREQASKNSCWDEEDGDGAFQEDANNFDEFMKASEAKCELSRGLASAGLASGAARLAASTIDGDDGDGTLNASDSSLFSLDLSGGDWDDAE
eukprot:TRINITY_DN10777_c0_g1_i1.p1 TRINITY_DN10777_c0_g1~~TRINITY_DN10777_c0_g1_i1.p1  ORF type:complete len:357 (+),score=100.63 TRINITY_DN10777_c0_g1_i1:183-1253(+)